MGRLKQDSSGLFSGKVGGGVGKRDLTWNVEVK